MITVATGIPTTVRNRRTMMVTDIHVEPVERNTDKLTTP